MLFQEKTKNLKAEAMQSGDQMKSIADVSSFLSLFPSSVQESFSKKAD
ncbi:MAG: hypothetical protein IJ506_01065 [Clostridia bacterium]|nr:hypothetical protein [Clostridia bacterium]